MSDLLHLWLHINGVDIEYNNKNNKIAEMTPIFSITCTNVNTGLNSNAIVF